MSNKQEVKFNLDETDVIVTVNGQDYLINNNTIGRYISWIATKVENND